MLHQANKRILESIGKRLKVSMDLIPENVSKYGNTSSASIPILLDEMVRDGKIQKGNKNNNGRFWRRAYMVSSLFGVLENYKP